MGILHKKGGKFHLSLNKIWRPIEEKYCEGKLKRIEKSKWKELEIVKREQKGGEGEEKWWQDMKFCELLGEGEDWVEEIRESKEESGWKLFSI